MAFTVWDSGKEKYIIDGHHRYKVLDLLESEGVEVPAKLPCTFIECKDKKEASKLVLMYSSIYAKVQEEGLYEFLNIENLDFESIKTEFDIPDIDFEKFELGYFKEQDEEKLNDVPELTETAVSKLGDIFVIDGKHRIMCGDSTKADDVEKLMDGKKADMLLTDPPYGVDYSAKNEMLNSLDGGKRIERDIKNDAIKDYRKFFANILQSVNFSDYNVFYIFMSGKELHNLRLAIDDAVCVWGDFLVWVKNNHVLGRKDYNSKHEFIVYGWKGKHKFYGESATTVLNYNRPTISDLHPTMKPIELLVRLIIDGSKGNMLVLDTFLGSGSTLIACEQTNRTCYGMELDPIYIDVILKRYKKLYPGCKIECLNRKFNVKYLD